MGILADLAELISPTRCAGCDLPGELLCESCRRLAMRFDPACSCPRCACPAGALVCTECWERSFAFESACAVGDLSSPLHRAVVLYKDRNERRLAEVLGGLLGRRVREQWPAWPSVVAWVPPTDEAIRRRGFDHAGCLAQAAAASAALEWEPLLSRSASADQRLLGRSARAANASGTFSAVYSPENVVLVDDVMTTGATLDAAATCLLDAGAVNVRVAVVARAW